MKHTLAMVLFVLLCLLPSSAVVSSPQTVTITLQPGETFTSDSPILDVTEGSLMLAATFTPIVVPPDTIAPVITLLTVAQNGKSKNYTVTVQASDAVGVVRVEVWLDGTLKATLTSAPYVTTLAVKTGGAHTVDASAFDAAGNVGLATLQFK